MAQITRPRMKLRGRRRRAGLRSSQRTLVGRAHRLAVALMQLSAAAAAVQANLDAFAAALGAAPVASCSECSGTGVVEEWDGGPFPETIECSDCAGLGHLDLETAEPAPGPCVLQDCAGCAPELRGIA